MIFRKHLLNGGLVLVATIIMVLSKSLPYRFKRFANKTAINSNLLAVVPFHYDVEMLLYFEDNFLFGDCSINMNINRQLKSINLYSVPLRVIDAVLINRDNISVHKFSSFTTSFYSNIDNILTINFDEEISPDVYTLNMMYTRIIHNERHLYQFGHQELLGIQRLKQTGVEIMKAPQLFPYINDPTINSTFKIAIRHDEFYNVLSNIPKRTQRRAGSVIWTDFDDESLLMSAQHIVVVITTMSTNVSSQLANVTIWCRESAREHILYAKYVIEQVFPYVKQEYLRELSKLDILVLWNPLVDNVFTMGFVQLREADICYNEMLHPAIRKWEVALTIARQLVLLWCNDAYFWSKEGFATFLGTYILDQVFPDKHMMNLMVVQAQSDSFRYDTPTWNILPYNTIPSNVSFLETSQNDRKSFIIWRMLYHLISDEFWRGIREYIDMHRIYSNMTQPDHLWTIFQTIHKKKSSNHTLYSDLNQIITSWTLTNSYVVLNMTRYYENTNVRINYMISPYVKYYINAPICTHVTFTTESFHKFDQFDRFVWTYGTNYFTFTKNEFVKTMFVEKKFDKNKLDKQEFDEELSVYDDKMREKSKSSDWILSNIRQIGYYRVNYDFENWQRLMRYLNSEDYNKLHILNRAQIIDDAFFFFLQRKINYNMFWNLTSFVSQDRNFVTWYPMFKAFESMSCICPFEYGGEIKRRMKNRLDLLLTEIGYFDKSADHILTIYLREEAVKWACILDIFECRLNAASKLNTELVDYVGTNSLMGKKWIYCYGLTSAEHYIWYKIWQKWNVTSDGRFLEYLICSEDSTIICNFLNMTILENLELSEGKRIKSRANAFLSTIAKHAKKDEVYSCLFQMIEDVRLTSNRKNDIIATLIIIITHIHKKDQLTEIAKFAMRYVEPIIMNAVKDKIRIRKLEYGRLVHNYGYYYSSTL